MNAFFAELLTRAQGRSPVLERRPRSLFEPVSDGAYARRPYEQSAEIETAAEKLSVVRRPPAPSPSTSQPATPQPVESPRVAAREARRVASEPDASEPPSTSHPSMFFRADERRIGESLTLAPMRAADMPAPRSSALGDDRTSRSAAEYRAAPVLAERHQHGPRSTKTPAPTTVVQHETRRESVRTASTPQHPALAAPLDVSQLATLRPDAALRPRLVASRSPLSTKPAAHAAHAAPEPAFTPAPVEITIGRVEIRATQPAVQRPARASSSGPRLSLDEYLRSRNGASR